MKLQDMSVVAREGFGRTRRQPCMSAKEIAALTGKSYQAVRGFAQRLGIRHAMQHKGHTEKARNTWYSLSDAKRIIAAIGVGA